MKLNLDILHDYLSGFLEIKKYGYHHKEMNLLRPIFHDGISVFESNNVYITTADSLPVHPLLKNGTVIICICNKNDIPEGYFNEKCSLLIINNSISIYKLFNMLQKLYDRYYEWDNELKRIVKGNGELKDLLEASVAVFENPIVFIDKDLKVLAYTSAFEKDKELNKEINFNSSDSIIEFNIYKDTIVNDRKNKKVFIYTRSNFDNMILNIYWENEYFGAIIIRGDYIRPLREGDKSLLYYLKEYLEESLNHYHKILNCTNNTIKRIVLNLLEGKILTNGELNELKINEKQKNKYILLKCKLENDDIIAPTKYASIQAEKFFPNSIPLVYNNYFLVLIKVNKINSKKLESNIIEYLRLLGYKGGVSNEFSNIIEIKDYYSQACAALEIGLRYNQGLRVYYFEDYVKEYIFSMITKEIPADKICSKELLKLADYDTNNGTDYFNELNVYIDNKMNAVQTAKKLFMHRNTFLTHMENINKIINIDLEDPDDRLYIHLSYKLLKNDLRLSGLQTEFV